MKYIDKTEALSKLLNDEYVKYINKLGHPISQNEFAAWISKQADKRISPASLSPWMNGDRLPTGDNAHALAKVFGMQVYDILGMPRFIPPIMELEKIAEQWRYLTEGQRTAIMAIVEGKKENSSQAVTEVT